MRKRASLALQDHESNRKLRSPSEGQPASVSCALGVDGMLWQQTTPHTIAKTAIDLFGMDAAQAIEWCARSAHHAGRDADLRFWRAVLGRLEEIQEDGKL